MIKNPTKSVTTFRISEAGEHYTFAPDDYSKYSERYNLKLNGSLPPDEEVYGYEQCLEHIEELRGKWYYGKLINKDKKFVILSTTTVTTTIEL